MLTKKRYNEIESILNNIKYTRSEPPKNGSYFELDGKYSKSVDNINENDLSRYLKIKYDNELKNAACILNSFKYKAIVFYDSDMNELRIAYSFDSFYYKAANNIIYGVNYISLLKDATNFSYLVATDLHSTEVYLRISDIPYTFKSVLKDVKIKTHKPYIPQVSFHIMSKSLSKEFNCYLSYKTLLNNINPTNILSEKDIQLAEYAEQNQNEYKLSTSLEKLYNNNKDLFNYYDDLNDERKLKLKLTGKLN